MTTDKIVTKVNNNCYHISHGVASRIGDSHINFPIGYQDAQFCINQNGVFVGVICDGCSLATDGYTQNQVGAILGAELIARNICKYAKGYRRKDVNFNYILRKANKDSALFFRRLLGNLRALRLRIDRKKFVEEKFLFTVIGLLIINDSYCFFGCGDGLFGINEFICDVEKNFPSQKYLQPLLNSKGAEKFTIYKTEKIKGNDTLWVASDGLLDFLNKEGGFENFKEFLNDERIGRIVEDNDQTIQPFRKLAQKYRNRLSDDITVVISKVRTYAVVPER
jgi:hypothetical protein